MKKLKNYLLVAGIGALLFGTSTNILSQTSGELTFSTSTFAPSANWGNKHTLAIWIENTANPSDFIKTRAKYGNDDDHLTAWVAKSGKNKVDAVTGPTLTSYSTRTSIWDGTNVSSVVVPDGEYKVFIEMGWGKDKTNDHSVLSFSFTKGPDAVSLTPTGNSHYSNVNVSWEPLNTLVDLNEVSNFKIYPNPTSGLMTLKINKSIPASNLIIENSAGALISKRNVEKGFAGELQIDLSTYSNGLYFIVLESPNQKFVYKVMLKK